MIRFAVCSVFALLIAHAVPASAKVMVGGDCGFSTRYDVRIEPGRLIFTDKDAPRVIELRPGGELIVDGAALALSGSDRAQAAQLERGVRALVPEFKRIALDAIAIVFEAMGQASAAFASSPSQARENATRIARTAHELEARIEAKQDWDAKADADLDKVIEGVVGALVGDMVGNITTLALKVAFSGDEAAIAELEARASAIEKTVDQAVEKRSAELEARAEGLCERVRELDAVEARIQARLPGDTRLDLITIER